MNLTITINTVVMSKSQLPLMHIIDRAMTHATDTEMEYKDDNTSLYLQPY